MKIEFDEATKKKAVEIWCQRSYDEMIDFLADVANRQLEVMEKPAFAGPKRQNHQAEIAGHLENGFRARGSYGGNFWHDVAEHAAMIVTSRFVVEPKSEDFNNSGAIEESGQAGVSPPLVEGGSHCPSNLSNGFLAGVTDSKPPAGERPALTDEELGRELLASIGMIPAQVLQQELAALGRRARELLRPASFAFDLGQWSIEQFQVNQALDNAIHRAEAAEKRAEKAEADKAKAEAALVRVRLLIEADLQYLDGMDDGDDFYSGRQAQCWSVADTLGFTIVPAQPLKVLRHD